MSPGAAASFGALPNPIGQFAGLGALGMGQPQDMPRGHGRRHSVNVVNKSSNSQGAMNAYGLSYGTQDGYEDGFAPPSMGGHSRQVSRADSTWRMSEFLQFETCFF
jgi:protein SSD1